MDSGGVPGRVRPLWWWAEEGFPCPGGPGTDEGKKVGSVVDEGPRDGVGLGNSSPGEVDLGTEEGETGVVELPLPVNVPRCGRVIGVTEVS